jgi:hypothetical protein
VRALGCLPRPGPGLFPAVLLGLIALAAHAAGQEPPDPFVVEAGLTAPSGAAGDVVPVGCPTCGGGGGLLNGVLPPPPFPGPLGPPPPSGPRCDDCRNCVPGRTNCCSDCDGKSAFGRFLCGIYDCICCPDPCYEGRWIPLADSALFVEAPRPVTQMKLRWDSANNFILPDRSEFFWARADGMGKGPKPVKPFKGELGLRYNDLWLITEGGNGLISLIVEEAYREIRPILDPHAAGFVDMRVATKTLLFDCELLQIAFMFRTYIPTGNFLKGLGTGHVSLEPSLLVGVKLSPVTYFQGQLSEWIPIGGDPTYQGSILHYHMSINQELWRILPDIPLIGTVEFNGWSFQDGAYTDPFLGGPQKSSDYTYAELGCGLRLFICDRIDFGIGYSHALTRQHFAEDFFRAEFRVRF